MFTFTRNPADIFNRAYFYDDKYIERIFFHDTQNIVLTTHGFIENQNKMGARDVKLTVNDEPEKVNKGGLLNKGVHLFSTKDFNNNNVWHLYISLDSLAEADIAEVSGIPVNEMEQAKTIALTYYEPSVNDYVILHQTPYTEVELTEYGIACQDLATYLSKKLNKEINVFQAESLIKERHELDAILNAAKPMTSLRGKRGPNQRTTKSLVELNKQVDTEEALESASGV